MNKCNDCEPKEDSCPEIGGPAVNEESFECCTIHSTQCIVTEKSDAFLSVKKGDTLTSVISKISSLFQKILGKVNGAVGTVNLNSSYNGVPLFAYTVVAGGNPITVYLPMFLTGLYCFEYETASPGVFDTFTVDSCMANFTIYDSSSTQITDPMIIEDLLNKIRNCETTNKVCVP